MTLSTRVPTLVAFTSDRGGFCFPRTAFEWESAQPFAVPHAALVGASYGHDFLGLRAAPKQPATETVRCLVTDADWSEPTWGEWDWGDGESVTARVAHLRHVVAGGHGRLWRQEPDGTRRWAWARALAMPQQRSHLAAAGAVPVLVSFRRQSDWYAEEETIVTVPVVPSQQASILPNGDFEEGIDGWLGEGATISHHVGAARTGDGAMDVVVETPADQAGARTPDVSIAAAKPYTARGWMLGVEDTPTCHLLLAQYDASHTFLGTVSSGGVELSTSEWREAVVAFTSHAEAAFVRVFLVTFGSQAAAFRVDDVTLNPNAQTVPFTVMNPGTATVHHAVFTIAGTVLSPVLRNVTTGEEVSVDFTGGGPDDVLRLDAARHTVEISDDGGESWTDAYDLAVLGDTQLGLLTLAPGENEFELTVEDDPDAEFRATFHPPYE
ncbi:MAG: hypothetical protein EA379_00455 [Phycisphaerales bacterium]|nr:MAG: hypothetical protein EA379_00455 [Phycisphaerales bacterium]